MMLSVINTNLRDRYPSLEEFCRAEDVDKDYVTKTLARIDYEYDAARNVFR